MDVFSVRKLCHATRSLPAGLDTPTEVNDTINSTIRKDENFAAYLAELNIDNLEERMIDFSRDENVVYGLEDLLHTLGQTLGGRFRFSGHVTRIGSCIDGSKVGRVNELDCLYVIAADIRTVPAGKYFKIFVDGREIQPSELVDEFADAVDNIASTWFETVMKSDDEKLKKFPYQFVGVRYNGPAVTMVFSPVEEDQSFVSLDLTTAFILPDDLHIKIKKEVGEKLSIVQRQNPRKLFKSHGLHLVPNVKDDNWLLSTAELEAELLRSLQDTTPLKRAFNYSKIISNDLARINENGLTDEVLNRLDSNQMISQDYLDISKHLTEWKTNKDKRIRDVHAIMSKEHAKTYNEMAKSHVSINTAALKHILLLEALNNPEAFNNDVNDDAVYEMVMKAYHKISTVEDFRIPHAFLPCEISTLSVCGYEVLAGHARELLYTAQQQCKMLYDKMEPKPALTVADSEDNKATYLDQYIVSDERLLYPEYMYDVATDFSMSPNRNPQATSARRIINALLNTCGGIVDMHGGVDLTAKSIEKWRTAFVQLLRNDIREQFDKLVFVDEIPKSSANPHLRIMVKPSFKLVVHESYEQKLVSYCTDNDGHILMRRTATSTVSTGEEAEHSSVRLTQNEEVKNASADDEAIDWFLLQATNVSWISHTKEWNKRIRFTGKQISLPEVINECEMFQLKTPANITPPTSLYWLPENLKDSLSRLPNCCALRSECWIGNLIGYGRATKLKGHFGDIFTLCGDHKHHATLIQIAGEALSDEDLQTWWTSLRISGRLTKKSTIDQLRKRNLSHSAGSIPHVHLCCQIYNGHQGLLPNSVPGNELPSWFSRCQECCRENSNSCRNMKMFRTGLGLAILSKDSHLRVSLNDSLLMQLTYEQGRQVIEAESKFNLIEGPPGSGKTIIALYLCDHYGAENCQYLCSTHALRAFVDYKRKAMTFVVEEGSDLSSFLKTRKLKRCLVLDDVQNMRCNKEEWLGLLEAVNKQDANLYVFVDCEYQNFRYENESRNLKQWFSEFCADKHPYILPLNKIHRNTRKVASFLAASIADDSGNVLLTCANHNDGDGIEIIKMPNVFSSGADNSLIRYLETLISTLYSPNHIAVLVDGIEARRKVVQIQAAINENSPMQAHGADIYPRRGITVETLDNFVGLDAQLCIFIFSEDVLEAGNQSFINGRHFSNPKYKTFIASRAIHKMVFMTESTLDHRLAKAMQLTEFPEAAGGHEGRENRKEGKLPTKSVALRNAHPNAGETDVFDLHTVVGEWGWRDLDHYADAKISKLLKKHKSRKNLISVDIDLSSCVISHQTEWSRFGDTQNSVRTLYATDLTNDTPLTQNYSLRVEKTTLAVCEVELKTVFLKGNEEGVVLKLPLEVLDDNVGFKRELEIHDMYGHTFEQELPWAVNSEIKVQPMHKAHVELQVHEKAFTADFRVTTKLTGMGRVTFKDRRNDKDIMAMEARITPIVARHLVEWRRRGREMHSVEVVEDNYVRGLTAGHCRFTYAVKQDVVLTQTPLGNV